MLSSVSLLLLSLFVVQGPQAPSPPPGALQVSQRSNPPPDGAQLYERVYDGFRRMTPAPDRVAAVKKLVLRRDCAEFQLSDGSLYLLTPVEGRVVGAVFVGTGTVSFTPPLAIERAQVRRLLSDSVLAAPIVAAVFLFADSTATELASRSQFAAAATPPDGDVADRVRAALAFLVDDYEKQVDATLMTSLLEGGPNGYFAGYVERVRGEALLIKIDPYEVEEVSMLRRGKLTRQRVQVVSQFQRAADLADTASRPGDERPEPLQLDAYRINATIADNLGFSASAGVRLMARRDSVRWVRLLLYSELKVDSVLDDLGAPTPYYRPDHSAELWVRFDPPLTPGTVRSVRVVYHGKLIDFGSLVNQLLPRNSALRGRLPPAADKWFFIKSTSTWYPRYSFWQPAAMDMTFRTPAKYRFASIGRLADTRVEGNVQTTRWVTETPTQQASFNIGEFEEFEIKDPRIPPVTVHMNRAAHTYLSDLFLAQQDPEKQVGSDVANSLSFFTNVFGPPLFTKYFATEIPYLHGQAFPGMIHLSWWTFQSTSESGSEESFRAHEMAHQWWGIGVEPVGYRDAWISEGFAQFAGLWYMQLILNNNDKYFRQLKDARDDIRGARRRAPPLALGYRILDTDPEDYSTMVYAKGAWVLHMLRNMMLNTRTMSEDRFNAMMRDFYLRYRGHHASTQDFQEVVERHTGLGMDWFFAQWVEGTDIPTYTLSWRSEPGADGKHLLKVRVRQEDVPPDFVMPVPLIIHFGDSSRVIVRVTVKGAVTEASIPLPLEPTRLELNPWESVLAEVKREGWKE